MNTIITVCFNAANDLEKTIRSVLAQQNCDVEYIIKDGGSKDHTKAVVEKYEPELRKLKNFVFISEKECARLRRRNNLKKISRQLISAGLYKKLKDWEFRYIKK